MNEHLESQLIAIEQALAPGGCIIQESTTKGLNLFHDEWQVAVAKENVYTPFFFPCYKDRRMFVDEYKEFSEMYKARNGKKRDAETSPFSKLPLENEKWIVYNHLRNNHRIFAVSDGLHRELNKII